MSNKNFSETKSKILKGLEKTYEKLIEYKKLHKSKLIILKNNKIEYVDPNDLTL